MLEAGADVNAHGEFGNTPLQEAVDQKNVDSVTLLLTYGGSPQKQNEFGQTVLDMARASGRDDILRLLQGFEESR